ncbi:thiamine diphosphokinase [Riemerella anatipestifer]|nr:thiamine diphosphokinase [Riemerella anatipestifer]MDY3532557.1 thiamine diphosphokinase [Riemerella anatipestifer]MDY3534888.1 thiamine diphosphokinase [Riemerella anatipestifer]
MAKESQNAVLYINGEPPKQLPPYSEEVIWACTDGAWSYLKQKGVTVDQLAFISGDFDSVVSLEDLPSEKVVSTPNQDFTDFYKALDLLKQKGITKVNVYGASGKEQDHFLGNLTVAYQFKEEIDITFYDDMATYFFIPQQVELKKVKGKTVSLYPFPEAKSIVTKGLRWSLNKEDLSITSRIGTRNIADEDTISISYASGSLLVFLSKSRALNL